MRIGYARVSTIDQNPALQEDALKLAGCDRVYVDRAGSLDLDRPELGAALDQCRAGDVLVVWKLDRLGRSVGHLIDAVGDLQARGVGFQSLTEGIDTTTAGGRFVFVVFAALAEFERDIIAERTRAGLATARANGRKGGRPSKVTPARKSQARRMFGDGATVSEVARILGVSRAALYRAFPELGGTRAA